RFFRVFDKEIQVPQADAANVSVATRTPDIVDQFVGHADLYPYEVKLPMTFSKVEKQQMSDIADLDTVLGYLGNYSIYPLLQNNFITLSMMLDYLEFSDEV